jgi:maleate cis-trans isomerase
MSVIVTDALDAQATVPQPRARIGLIIPAVNRVSEREFNHFAPPGLGIHVTRAQIAGKWRSKSLAELADEITKTTSTLAECDPDIIVYHCTSSSMKEGPNGERRILQMMRTVTDIEVLSTSALVGEALRALGLKSVVLIAPYMSNADIIAYLRAIGVEVVHDVALRLPAEEFANVTPQRWFELAKENDHEEADGVFLSCTATRQIEAIAAIEAALDKPVVNSNQAVLWGCLKRLQGRLGPLAPIPALGRLMQELD